MKLSKYSNERFIDYSIVCTSIKEISSQNWWRGTESCDLHYYYIYYYAKYTKRPISASLEFELTNQLFTYIQRKQVKSRCLLLNWVLSLRGFCFHMTQKLLYLIWIRLARLAIKKSKLHDFSLCTIPSLFIVIMVIRCYTKYIV